MNTNDRDSRRSVAWLLRLGHVNRSPPTQFSLQSALLAVTAICILTWLIQILVRNLFAEIPLVAHLLLAYLCAIVVGGLIFSAGAKWYFGGGLLGTLLASPALLYVFVHDLEEVPFLTVWYTLFIFAVSATLGGAVWWLINDRDCMAAAHFAAFAAGIVSIIALIAA